MKLEIRTQRNKLNIFTAILFLIVGALLVSNPDKVIAIISYIVGTLLIIMGIYSCIKNYYNTKADSNTPANDLVLGITVIVIGILFLLLANSIGVAVRYVFGAWIIFSGLSRLISSLQLDKKSNLFITQISIASLLILIGLYTILAANVALQVVGIIMMVYSILEIVSILTNKSLDNSKNNDIIIDKVIEPKTEAKVKEAKIVKETKKKK